MDNLFQYTQIKRGLFSVTAGINHKKMGEFYTEIDGFYVFVPEPSCHGCWSADMMRELVVKLDELNKPWQAEIDKYHAGET